MTDDKCIFCRIVRGDLPATIVHDDVGTMAFMDAMPQSNGHVLVIPKRHAETIFDVGADEAAQLIRLSHRVAHAIRASLQPDGLMLAQFNGRAAGQTVGHLHFHLIPRAFGSELKFHATAPAKAEDLAHTRDRIKAAFTA